MNVCDRSIQDLLSHEQDYSASISGSLNHKWPVYICGAISCHLSNLVTIKTDQVVLLNTIKPSSNASSPGKRNGSNNVFWFYHLVSIILNTCIYVHVLSVNLKIWWTMKHVAQKNFVTQVCPLFLSFRKCLDNRLWSSFGNQAPDMIVVLK